MIGHLQGRERALIPFGWRGREAEWIALVCLHSGVFTRAQFCLHLNASRMTALRFVRRLVDEGLATEDPMPPRFDRRPAGRPPSICRIFRRQIYEALGAENLRPRKITSNEVLTRALLSLDYVSQHLELSWLPTEAEKVGCFEQMGLDRRLLPRRIYQGAVKRQKRYFALKLPIALDSDTATFVYVDPGHETSTGLRYWGAAHRDLWEALHEKGKRVQAVAVARQNGALQRAERVLGHWASGGVPKIPGRDPSAGREYARIKRAVLTGDKLVLDSYGGVTPALKRAIELESLAQDRPFQVAIDGYSVWRPQRFR